MSIEPGKHYWMNTHRGVETWSDPLPTIPSWEARLMDSVRNGTINTKEGLANWLETYQAEVFSSLIKKLEINDEAIEALTNLIAVQTSDGNWNYDPYMHGMANGMLLALSVFDGTTPDYLEAPKEWLCDNKSEHIIQ